MTVERSCIACGRGRFVPLPQLPRSMRSDGRILDVPLRKECCSGCGLVRHSSELDAESVGSLFGEDYELPSLATAQDEARAQAYFDVIASALPQGFRPSNVLEVGSGSGALARRIARDLTAGSVVGIDPAGPSVEDGNLTLRRGLLDDAGEGLGPFDLVFSINTLEHVADPRETLRQLEGQLSDDGLLVVVCPAATPANVELLFYDHLWSFTSGALVALATQGALNLVDVSPLPQSFGDFQRVILRREAPTTPTPRHAPGESSPHAYLEAWRSLDARLVERCGAREVCVFGAGQMAALVRCYAPELWSRCSGLVMDNPDDSWGLGPVAEVPSSLTPEVPIVVATHPRHHAAIAERIRTLGGRAVRFDDLIER